MPIMGNHSRQTSNIWPLTSGLFTYRQEVMDLVAKSGKFSKKFEGFTGELLSVAEKSNQGST